MRPVSVGTGVDDVGDVADGAVQAADGAMFSSGDSIAAPAVVDATWSGESGSLGGVGMTWIGDTPYTRETGRKKLLACSVARSRAG